MSPGTQTLIRPPINEDLSADTSSPENLSLEDQNMQRLVETRLAEGFFLKSKSTYLADTTHFQDMFRSLLGNTSVANWGIIQPEPTVISNIWDNSNLKAMLEQPLGTPIELTFEEANEIVRRAAGRRPDLPAGKEIVKEIREILGHSLLDRIKKAD